MKKIYVLRVYWKNGTQDEKHYDSWEQMKTDLSNWLYYSVGHLSDLVDHVTISRQMEG